ETHRVLLHLTGLLLWRPQSRDVIVAPLYFRNMHRALVVTSGILLATYGALTAGLLTQGRGDGREWVSSFSVSYSMDAFHWKHCLDANGHRKHRSHHHPSPQQRIVPADLPAEEEAQPSLPEAEEADLPPRPPRTLSPRNRLFASPVRTLPLYSSQELFDRLPLWASRDYAPLKSSKTPPASVTPVRLPFEVASPPNLHLADRVVSNLDIVLKDPQTILVAVDDQQILGFVQDVVQPPDVLLQSLRSADILLTLLSDREFPLSSSHSSTEEKDDSWAVAADRILRGLESHPTTDEPDSQDDDTAELVSALTTALRAAFPEPLPRCPRFTPVARHLADATSDDEEPLLTHFPASQDPPGRYRAHFPDPHSEDSDSEPDTIPDRRRDEYPRHIRHRREPTGSRGQRLFTTTDPPTRRDFRNALLFVDRASQSSRFLGIRGIVEVFLGNSDSHSLKLSYLDPPLQTRFSGCTCSSGTAGPACALSPSDAKCNQVLSVPPVSRLTASSWRPWHPQQGSCSPDEGQLFSKGGWYRSLRAGNQWLQVDLGPPTRVFGGNMDRDTERRHYLNVPFVARFVRFQPSSWKRRIALRVAVIGCPHRVLLLLCMASIRGAFLPSKLPGFRCDDPDIRHPFRGDTVTLGQILLLVVVVPGPLVSGQRRVCSCLV
ncbi:lactadherin/mfg-E8, putative, partial [Ixodes scapularis]